MRLREVQAVLNNAIIKKGRLGWRSLSGGGSGYYATNINNFKEFLEQISVLPFFSKEVNSLSKSELFTTTQDELFISSDNTGAISEPSGYLSNASEALLRVFDIALAEQKEHIISVKLPDANDLSTLTNYLSKFEKAVTQVITNDKIKGHLQINSWESGSFWVELLLGTQAAVSLIAGIAWSAAVITKKIKEGKLIEEHIRSLKIKNESLEDILEQQKKATALLIENETKHLYSEHFGTEHVQETYERLKLAIKTLADLIQNGAEIHPSLAAPEKVHNLFPNFTKLDSITSQIKQLTSEKTENGG